MLKKIDYSLSGIVFFFGVIYCILTFVWGQLELKYLYFPAVSLMYLIAGVINLARLKDKSLLIVKLSVFINATVLIYAVYLTYLVRVAIPPYIATTILAFVFLLSILNLRSNKEYAMKV